MALAVVILEVMWDWNSKTSSAGYIERAPEYFRINPHNLSGSRIYRWLGKPGEYVDDVLVTNACPELVSSARGRGKPDVVWLHNNLADLQPFKLLLVCGKVAQATYLQESSWYQREEERVVCLPHPAARNWSRDSLAFAGRLIREGKSDLQLSLSRSGKLTARALKIGEV